MEREAGRIGGRNEGRWWVTWREKRGLESGVNIDNVNAKMLSTTSYNGGFTSSGRRDGEGEARPVRAEAQTNKATPFAMDSPR